MTILTPWADIVDEVEGVRAAYALATRLSRREMLERSEAWRPYRTFATWYI